MSKFNFKDYLISSGFTEYEDGLNAGAFSIEIESDKFIIYGAEGYLECDMSKHNADICIKIANLFDFLIRSNL